MADKPFQDRSLLAPGYEKPIEPITSTNSVAEEKDGFTAAQLRNAINNLNKASAKAQTSYMAFMSSAQAADIFNMGYGGMLGGKTISILRAGEEHKKIEGKKATIIIMDEAQEIKKDGTPL